MPNTECEYCFFTLLSAPTTPPPLARRSIRQSLAFRARESRTIVRLEEKQQSGSAKKRRTSGSFVTERSMRCLYEGREAERAGTTPVFPFVAFASFPPSSSLLLRTLLPSTHRILTPIHTLCTYSPCASSHFSPSLFLSSSPPSLSTATPPRSERQTTSTPLLSLFKDSPVGTTRLRPEEGYVSPLLRLK
jgi:hypothetical protein